MAEPRTVRENANTLNSGRSQKILPTATPLPSWTVFWTTSRGSGPSAASA